MADEFVFGVGLKGSAFTDCLFPLSNVKSERFPLKKLLFWVDVVSPAKVVPAV